MQRRPRVRSLRREARGPGIELLREGTRVRLRLEQKATRVLLHGGPEAPEVDGRVQDA